jgi:rRNA-processing protein FCF1
MDDFFKFKEVILDANVLLPLLIGLYNKRELVKFNYKEEDFALLVEFIRNFDRKVVTPQVLAEISNLAENKLKGKFFDFIKNSIRTLMNLEEKYVNKNDILQKEKEVQDFGITDTSLIEAVNRDRLLLTADGPLFGYCSNNKIPVIHLDTIPSLLFK